MASWRRTHPSTGITATIDNVGEDLLQNIFARLPALSFAYAACISRSWNLVCNRVLCRPKLSSACLFNSSLHVAVEGVLNKVLSEPIRPHFVIAFVCRSFDLPEAHQLITAKLGAKVPVITKRSAGIIGRDAISDEFKEVYYARRGITLTVGFVPGLKVNMISLRDPQPFMIDKFITDIWEFSIYISGRRSPIAIMIFTGLHEGMDDIMEKIDYAMSPETVIVGDFHCYFQHTNGGLRNTAAAAIALVFAKDRKKVVGIGETRFHVVVSRGLIPAGPTYEVTSVKKERNSTWLTSRREESRENVDGGRTLNQAYDELGDWIDFRSFYIGVTKSRICSIGQEKVGWMTSFSFHKIRRGNQEQRFLVGNSDIKIGDTFRFYRPDITHALSSIANVSNQLRSFKQRSIYHYNKLEVFGGLIFTSFFRGKSFSDQPNVASSPYLDNFPSVTLGGTFDFQEIAHGDLTPHGEVFQEQKLVRCCVHEWSVVYLIMSYTR